MLPHNSKLSFCWLFFFFSLISPAQTGKTYETGQNFPFKNIGYINSKHGLNGSIVDRILQDNDGFLWFITDVALNRFDGYSFRSWPHIPGDDNSPVSVSDGYSGLAQDKNGLLWFSHINNGFYSFDPKTEKFIHYRRRKKQANSLSSENVLSVFQKRKMMIST